MIDKKLIIADYSLEIVIAIIHYDYNILTHNIGILWYILHERLTHTRCLPLLTIHINCKNMT